MKTTQQTKEFYEANPESWIVIMENKFGANRYSVHDNPKWNHQWNYQLIHIRHKEVLDAYLDNNKVEIEFYSKEDLWFPATFIENYNPDLEYRIKETKMEIFNGCSCDCDCRCESNFYHRQLKEKEDGHSRTSSDTDTTMDNSMVPDNNNKPMNSFEQHGFQTPSFEGEILKEVDGWLIGYVIRQPRVLAIRWDNDGQDCNNYGYNLTPVKLEWFDYPENYPAMLIRDTEEHLGHKWVDNKKDFMKSHRQGFRLITKAERDSYFCKED